MQAKAKAAPVPPLNLEELDDEVESSIDETRDEEEATSSNDTKPNFMQKSRTLVESLVSSSSNTDCTSPTSTGDTNTPNSLSNFSSNNSSRSHSTKTKTEKPLLGMRKLKF
ncbi:hypothetical protein EVAR_72642_1 [Eumeta japonica]|uniref:Uncharacterized protein n=1 Tax=Eumeta variegata TaxID=151549 RepID=A0A4C1TEA9_EUMVA|nr:hypothetical protein EVAR_72642_1 [Eumeta japonica]